MTQVREALGLDDAPPVTIVPIITRRKRRAPVLPPVTQPVIDLPTTEKAYKVPFQFSKTNGWNMSMDGGKTNEATGQLSISGAPVDLSLAITPASWKEGAFDWRLSLEFVDEEGTLCEINLNALRPSKKDPSDLVLTGPTRALLGSLLAITDEDSGECDAMMASFMNGAMFTLKQGNVERSQYIELAIVQNTGESMEWIGLSKPKYTARVLNTPAGLVDTVERIKHTLRIRNYLNPTPAVTGREQVEAILNPNNDTFTVVPVESIEVD